MRIASSGGAAAPISPKQAEAPKPSTTQRGSASDQAPKSSSTRDAATGAKAISKRPIPTRNFVDEAERTGHKLVIAHRGGVSVVNATTLDGIEGQAKRGTKQIEIKPQRLKDGTLVAASGPKLSSGDRKDTKLADLTLRELREGVSYDHIPTLDEVGAAAKRLNVKVAVSVDPGEDGNDAVRLARDSIATLSKHVPSDKAAAFSRDAATDAQLRAKLPKQHMQALEVDSATTPGERPRTQLDALRKTAMDGISDAVEVDWNRLKDGTIVANHNNTFDDGPLKGRLLADATLEQVRAGGYDMPTVDEYAAEAARLDMNVVADIKSTGGEVAVMEGLLRHLPAEQLTAFSFEPEVVRNLDKRYEDIPVGFLPRQYDSSNSAERLRQRVLGDSLEQIRALGITPDYIEVSSDNVNTEVLDYAKREGFSVMAGGTSANEKIQLFEDQRVMGFMIDDSSPMPTLRDERYEPKEHGTLMGPKDQGTMWGAIPVVNRVPVAEEFLVNRANDVYSWAVGTESGRRVVNTVTSGVGAVKDAARGVGNFVRDPSVIFDGIGNLL